MEVEQEVGEGIGQDARGSRGEGEGELLECLARMNGERREYAVLVAEEEDEVHEAEDDEQQQQQQGDEDGIEGGKNFLSVVLDYPQFLGQGETRESALRHANRLLHYAFGTMLVRGESLPLPSDGDELEAKRAEMERDWQLVNFKNFSMDLVPLQFQSGIDYTARPPKSDDEYDSDREEEEFYEIVRRMN